MVLLGILAAVVGVKAAGIMNAGPMGLDCSSGCDGLGTLMRRRVSPLWVIVGLSLILLSWFQLG
ncbi:MAG: hypothetical protein R2864_13305 [Syntrophotaleaceae bacterium]